jgi:hypothetical protein
MSVREKPSTSSGTTFVRGGEALAAPNRRKKGDVNTTLGSVGFTAEETTSFYGKLVGLPSNVRLRTQLLPDVNPAASLGDSTGWMLPAADVESRVSSSCDPPNKLSESNIGFQVCTSVICGFLSESIYVVASCEPEGLCFWQIFLGRFVPRIKIAESKFPNAKKDGNGCASIKSAPVAKNFFIGWLAVVQ